MKAEKRKFGARRAEWLVSSLLAVVAWPVVVALVFWIGFSLEENWHPSHAEPCHTPEERFYHLHLDVLSRADGGFSFERAFDGEKMQGILAAWKRIDHARDCSVPEGLSAPEHWSCRGLSYRGWQNWPPPEWYSPSCSNPWFQAK